MASYDQRTGQLLPSFNVLLSRHYLPTVAHPSEITTSLLIALYESFIQSRLASIDRKDKSTVSQIRNVKLLLGTMVMDGWDVGNVDPVGVVEREETCLMDMIQVLVDVGNARRGVVLPASGDETADADGYAEEHSDGPMSPDSTPRPFRRGGAHAILPRLSTLDSSMRSRNPRRISPDNAPGRAIPDDASYRPVSVPSSPVIPDPSSPISFISITKTSISRGTQTSPPPPPPPPSPRKPRRRPRYPSDSSIPSSIPQSYSSSHSDVEPRRRTRTDSPYTATLRRRRQRAIDMLRRRKRHKVRVFASGRDVSDSTFVEDSDASPRPARGRAVDVGSGAETTEGVTDLERRVEAMRIWAGLEEERRRVLLNSLQRKLDEGDDGDEDTSW